MSYQPRLKKEFNERIVPSLKEEYSYKNVMMVPRLKKIVISKGVGGAVADKKLIDHAIDELTMISGQKAIPTISKKDVASFKLRKGMPIGAKVTLRSERMYEFLDRLITSALPRVRDFQGIKPSGFDGRGNYNLGVTEQIIFPEIDIDKVNKISGMDISFVTSANTDKEAQSLLIELGLPFKKSDFKTKLSELKNIKTENTVIKDEAPVVEDTVEDEAVVEDTVEDEAPVVEDTVEDEAVVEDTVEDEAVVEDTVEDEVPVVEDTVEDDEAPVVEESSSEKENKTE